MKNAIKFSKKIVGFCIGFIVLFTIVSTYLNYRVGIELSPTLTTCVYAFFGTDNHIFYVIVLSCENNSTAGFFGYHVLFSLAVLMEAIKIRRIVPHWL